MRLVVDTHVWLDLLVFEDDSVFHLQKLIAEKTATIFIDAACRAELERVLGYPFGRKTLDAERQRAVLAQAMRTANLITHELSREDKASLPRCRDPDDQVFLEAALAAHADALVTKDRALLELNRRRSRPLPFRVLAPAALADEGRAPGTPTRRSPRT